MQPLSGILVLDFTTLLPGPLATLLLAEADPPGERSLDLVACPPHFDERRTKAVGSST